MKTLNQNYSDNHGSTHETFTDLMFLALVVLVLFVLTLAIEVSQRIRTDLTQKPIKPIPEVNEAELVTMTKEELAELSRELQLKRVEVNNLQKQLETAVNEIKEKDVAVSNKIAALAGEQRFTGAREPASLFMAYDLNKDLYYFVPSREAEHADRRQSGEDVTDYFGRKTKEFVTIALHLRTRRGFTKAEAKSIFSAFSKYKEVRTKGDEYEIADAEIGLVYHNMLSGYIAGETSLSDVQDRLIELKLMEVFEEKSTQTADMYPQIQVRVIDVEQRVELNGVKLSARDLKDILLALQGRGAVIDFVGLDGPAPDWLMQGALIPAGYISKTPKAPD